MTQMTPRKKTVSPLMLVLAPTRELACQSYEVLDEFCKIVGARVRRGLQGPRRRREQQGAQVA